MHITCTHKLFLLKIGCCLVFLEARDVDQCSNVLVILMMMYVKMVTSCSYHNLFMFIYFLIDWLCAMHVLFVSLKFVKFIFCTVTCTLW